MIARFTTLLPFFLTLRQDEVLAPYEFQMEPYRVKVYPPRQARITYTELGMFSSISTGDIASRIEPAAAQTSTNIVQVDGLATIQANLLQIDFQKADFDRRNYYPRPSEETNSPEGLLTWGDPKPALAFDIANCLIAKLRTVTRGCELQALDPNASFWRLDYLTNEGKHIPRESGLVRRRGGRPFRARVAVVTKAIWEKAQELPPDFSPQTWDSLVLDAEALLPDVDAAVALANVALEVFGKWLLDRLAASHSIPAGLWEWINNRDDWMKEPSVSDRFDPLLKVLTGRSLKDDHRLWTAYKELREARNSFIHKGRPMVGGKRPRVVTAEMAAIMVGHAKEIIDWCEALLPANSRRPKLTVNLQFLFPINTDGLPTLRDAEEEKGGDNPSTDSTAGDARE